MSQTKDIDVRYVAHLARLHLSEEEVKTFQAQLGSVLAHIEELNALEVSGVEPTAHARPRFNVWREDQEKPSLDVRAALANAPKQANDLITVPKVVE